MIKHVVMWKLKESAQGASKAENADRIKRELVALGEKLPFVRRIEVGINFNQGAGAFDVVLYSEFESREDLGKYQKAPEHQIVADFVGSVRESRVVVDYEV